ncbi:AAA family ATPase [Geodermatophilus chilensis]|uniref:AAA family ATPase n=1 Tax=Geodermatophilus chilensis TaxID=2035835 RepID=UPI000C269F3D|nr:AAA family ATPase [Geodermatophilus chilensis]
MTSTALSPFVAAVGDYTDAGWTGVLPLPAEAKFPPPRGFTGPQGAWPDADQLAAWTEAMPDGNVALRLPDTVLGIDVDAYGTKLGAETLAAHEARWGALPATWRTTNREDGVSAIRYYRIPAGLSWPSWLGGKDDGVEIIRTGHRYAVVPPSIHPEGRPYRWVTPDGRDADRVPSPEELAELPDAWVTGLTGGQAERAQATTADVERFLAGLPAGEPDGDVRRILGGYLDGLTDGDTSRHGAMLAVTWELAVAGATGAQGVPSALAEAEAAFVDARTADGGSRREAVREWDRGLSGAVSHLIENAVPVLEPFDVPADLLAALDAHLDRRRRGSRPADVLVQDTASADPFGDRLITRRGLAKLPEPEPLISDTIDRRTVALLAGYHGTGKSFVALAWGACVATGTPWMGRPVRKGRVLYIVGEGAHGIDGRLDAWEQANGVEIPDEDFVTYPAATQLADPGVREAILRHLDRHPYDLIIVDTVARSTVGLDENSARDMGLFIDAAEQLKRATDGGTVLLVHHTGKDKATVRGSSALEAAMDTVYTTEGDPLNMKLRRTKRKDGPMEDQLHLRLTEVGRSAVLQSLDVEVQRKTTDSDLDVRAFVALGTAFGDRVFTKAEAVTVLTDEEQAALSRASAYRVITRLGFAAVLHSVDGANARTVRFVLNRDAARKLGFPDARPFAPEPTDGGPFDLSDV